MALSKNVLTIVRVLLGTSLLAAIFCLVEWGEIVEILANISALDVLILLIISLALVLVSVFKWRGFLERLGIKRSVWSLYKLYLIGYFVNFFMPSAVGGDVVRSLYVGSTVKKTGAFSATFLERYTGLVAMVCMALCALPFAPVRGRGIGLLVVSVAVGVFAATVCLWRGSFISALSRFSRSNRLRQILEDLHNALVCGVSDGPLLRRAACLSVLFHVLTVVNTMAVASAVGWTSASWSNLLVVVPLILLLGSIPLAPQGLGIQEGVALFFLTAVGATNTQALAVAIVLRAKSYVLALAGGTLWAFSEHGFWSRGRVELPGSSRGGAGEKRH